MPLYEYKCNCGAIQEKLVSHSATEDEKERAHCKECRGVAKRIISLGSFELKGNWFKTKGKY
jgi:putative FmdB family regulatory protein